MDIRGKYKSYPTYKDSGIEWLGKVPEHWKVKRVKHVAELQLSNVDKLSIDGQPLVQLCNYMDVYRNEKITSAISFMQATASLEQIRRLSLKKDDVLLTKDSETPDDIGITTVVSEELDGVVCGYHLALLRPYKNLFCGSFLMRAIQSLETKAYFEVEAVGMTRFGIGKQAIASTPILVPSLVEQQAIATFLDHETAKIDTLIAEQGSLIELLQEKRTVLISHAVTKGLNPDAPMKDSGVEWLGEVPKHWLLVTFRRILDCQVINGIFKKKEDFGTGTLLINVFDIYNKDFLIQELKLDRVNCNSQEIASYEACTGDLFFVRSS